MKNLLICLSLLSLTVSCKDAAQEAPVKRASQETTQAQTDSGDCIVLGQTSTYTTEVSKRLDELESQGEIDNIQKRQLRNYANYFDISSILGMFGGGFDISSIMDMLGGGGGLGSLGGGSFPGMGGGGGLGSLGGGSGSSSGSSTVDGLVDSGSDTLGGSSVSSDSSSTPVAGDDGC